MSVLNDKQIEFTKMVGKLIAYAYRKGYGLTVGDAYRDPRVFGMVGTFKGYGRSRSNHKIRLAIDLNLFRWTGSEWEYCTETEDHEPLGRYWESMGGSWGGAWGDGNHYSIPHNGRR